MSEWSYREDFCKGGGKAVALPGRDETVWLIHIDQPTPYTGRLILREYDDGRITIERGRVWMPQADGDQDDNA